VILDDVAGRADAVVVAGATADTDVLGHGDLDVVDVVAVPDGLEELVGEADGQEVLDGLLAQVVVDPEDRVRREHSLDDRVEFAGGFEVVAERLLDDHAPPRAVGAGRHPGTLQLSAYGREGARRDREIEGVVAAGSAALVEFGESLGQPVEGVVVIETARHKAQALGEATPDLLLEGRPSMRFDRVVNDLGEVLDRPIPAGEADQREAWGQ
jgi:hypothetical protein